MRLPFGERSSVGGEKILEYLLSPTHPQGRHKAAFFAAFGFRREDWRELAEALREHAIRHEIADIEKTSFGTRYTVEGIMLTSDGRAPNIRAVWFIDAEEELPRFVTAYPLRRPTS